jgi:DNA-binding MarR family transcriptional regulator
VSAAGASGVSAVGAAGRSAVGDAGSGTREVADPLELESQICFALSVASRGVVAAYRPVLEPLGLTHPQYLVMLALWQHAPLSGRELSRLLRLDPGTLSPLLKRLEAQGLLTRGRRADDERALSIELTPAGAGLRREAESIPGRMMARLGVTHDELVVLHRTMTKLIVAADAEGD